MANNPEGRAQTLSRPTGCASRSSPRYADLPLGSADASVAVAAERLGIGTIATFDRRHFGVVRPSHRQAFDLLPA